MENCFIKKIKEGFDNEGGRFIFLECDCDGMDKHIMYGQALDVPMFYITDESLFEYCTKDEVNEEEIAHFSSVMEDCVLGEFEKIFDDCDQYSTACNTVEYIETIEGKIMNLLLSAYYYDLDEVIKAYAGKEVMEVEFPEIDPEDFE